MRILRVAQKIYPAVVGGGAYHVHALSRDQAVRGHDVTVLTVQREGQARFEERDGYTVIRRPGTLELLGNELSIGIARFLRRVDDFDVVHAHSHLYFSTLLAALACRLDETPLAITNHGLYSQTAPEWLFDAYLKTAGRWVFNSADTIFTYTNAERDELRNLNVRSPIEVIPNGIDTDRFAPEGPAAAELASPSMLFVGRLVDGKRPEDAVRTLAAVRDRGVDATLYIAGEGPQRETLERVATEQRILEHIVFLGHVPYERMPEIYRAADLLLLPSRTEGVPRTVLEAMATGTPVVTSALDQLVPLVRKGGVTVPLGDTDRFADKCTQLLEDGSRRKTLGRRARESVLDGWDWESTVARTTEALLSLSDGSARQGSSR